MSAMEQWALEHPWMTFFILMTFAGSFPIVFRFGGCSCKCKGKE